MKHPPAPPPRPMLCLPVLVLACAHTLRIPQPTAGPGAPLPPLAPSRIEVPLTADVRATLAALEATVPAVLDTGGQFRMMGPTPVGVRYTVRRAPFRFEARDGALHAETTLALSAEACLGAPLGIPLPFLGASCQPVASCGVNEAPRQIVVGTDTTLRLDTDFHLVAHTQPMAPQVRDRCELTAFRIDVSDVVSNIVAERVAEATRRMDQDLAARGDLRPRAEAFWASLHEPVELGEGFWLALQPESLHAAPLALDPNTVRSRVGITARPHVVAGARPTVDHRALPPLTQGSGDGGGFRMTFDATVGFAEATAMVAQEFRGRTLELEGRQVLVRDLRVEGRGAALVFEIDVRFTSGAFDQTEGTVYMAGVPDYDPAAGALVVRNLDYTLETRNVLLRVGEWLTRGSLRSALERRAVFPLGERLERLRQRAQAALARDLAPGARLRGSLSTVRPVGAYVTADGIVVRVVADGTAEVTQDLSSLGLTSARE